MKNLIHIQIMMMSILFVAPAFAANPFLDAKDDMPVSVNFRGKEWNDEYINGEVPLTAKTVTTRIASMAWGAITRLTRSGAGRSENDCGGHCSPQLSSS